MTNFSILLISNGLQFSPSMSREEARDYILAHPEFPYRMAALI